MFPHNPYDVYIHMNVQKLQSHIATTKPNTTAQTDNSNIFKAKLTTNIYI